MFIATCPPGLEDLLEAELAAAGAEGCVRAPGAVHFQGPWRAALTAVLWARVPNRILWVLAQVPAQDREALYAGARALPWHTWLHPDRTISVNCARGEGALNHTHFVALVLKDAIVDAMRAETGHRPSVDAANPDSRLHVHIRRGEALIAYDLSGESLHRRGYRLGGGDAPLKENVAAAMLMRSGWPGDSGAHPALIDPMCGSGTLVIEAVLMALRIPANGHRVAFGVDALRVADRALWADLRAQAHAATAAAAGKPLPRAVFGYDVDAAQLRCAEAQAHKAGVARYITFRQQDVSQLKAPPGAPAGMVVTNPPFGERLGGPASAVRALLGTLGQALGAMKGYTGHVLVADQEMGFALGLRAHKTNSILHGPLACTLLHLRPQEVRAAGRGQEQLLHNRLRKNVKSLKSYLKEQNICAYRLYDADLPEYSVAVDIYEDTSGTRHAHVQEYAAPAEVPDNVAQARLRRALEAVGEVMEIRPENMALKVRRRQKPTEQYGKDEARRVTGSGRRAKQAKSEGFWVMEGGLRYRVDLHSYVDTGLFLDHRRVRAWMAKHAQGKSLLNLFGYTGSVSVAAAHGGAVATDTVDLSATYLSWAEENFAANHLLNTRHRLIQADCLSFITQRATQRYDLAFVNPPTFSNSKRMDMEFDLVRDHGMLLDATMAWVKSDGAALFSTHARRLRMDPDLMQRYAISEITNQVRPKDFDRAKNGCRAWLIRHRGVA